MADRIEHPVIPADGLPTPRIELRWRDPKHEERIKDGHTSVCDYDLVIGLREADIRLDDTDGRVRKGSREYRVNLGKTGSSGNAASRFHPDFIEGPFLDSSHAMWDGVQLGRPPIYKIAAGHAQLMDYPQHVTAAGVRACGSNECVAGQRDGVLCADGECDRANGVRPAGVKVEGGNDAR